MLDNLKNDSIEKFKRFCWFLALKMCHEILKTGHEVVKLINNSKTILIIHNKMKKYFR